MVYKIVGNINGNFGEIVNELMEFNRLIVKNGCIYVAFNDYKGYEEYKEKIDGLKGIWKDKDVLVMELGEDNLKNEDGEIVEWCRDNLVRLEREKYEINEQPRLKQMYDTVDLMEEILKEQQLNSLYNSLNENKKIKNKNKKGGQNGSKESKKGRTGRRPTRNN